jgi:4-hydroxy-2-oxoheptanedioate aldolase
MSERHEPLNRLKTLWRDGRTVLGAIATIPPLASVQVMACSGLDFIQIDVEHGPIDVGIAQVMIAAMVGSPLVPR